MGLRPGLQSRARFALASSSARAQVTARGQRPFSSGRASTVATATPCAKLLGSDRSWFDRRSRGRRWRRHQGPRSFDSPTRVTVGGRPAQQVRAHRSQGCRLRPGFLLHLAASRAARRVRGYVLDSCRASATRSGCGSSMWAESQLFLEAESSDVGRDLSYEISRIVRSIRFD